MCDATSNISPLMVPKNILWVETYYDCVEQDEENKNSDIIWESETRKIPYIDVFLQFQFQKLTNKKIRLTCIRTIPSYIAPEMKPDNGYTLQFRCSISLVDNEPIIFDMLGKQTIAYELFRLKAPFEYKPFESKILVKMFEYEILPTYVYLRQEDDLHEMKERFFKSEIVLRNLCYLLQIPRLQGLFTGRLDFEYAAIKSTFIKRAAKFSTKIADYLRAKDALVPVPLINLGFILNNILNDEQEQISNQDLIKLYFQSHRMGLKFLADMSRDCISESFGNPNMVIDALHAADCVDDEALFHMAAQSFHTWEKAILNSERWLKMLEDSNVKCRFIIYSLRRRLLKIESCGPDVFRGIFESSFFKIL